MLFGPMQVIDKLGRTVILRNAKPDDADALISFLKITAGETPFLIREPEEVVLTTEQEKAFIWQRMDSPRDLFLVATIDGEHVGNCSLGSPGQFQRYQHRCDISIALYSKYCGAGIGHLLLQTILSVAKEQGYEQAELEVSAGNSSALALYKKVGFEEFGRFPNSMKYKDGTYSDSIWMVKVL